MLKVFCHHGCSVWIKYYFVYHLNRWSIGHDIVGMGSGLISLAIAASLAEICAVYPTAGGVYY